MRKFMYLLAGLALLCVQDAYGYQHGRGGGARGGGGGFRGGGGGVQQQRGGAAMANRGGMQRPATSAPNLGAQRPQMNRPMPSAQRPNIQRPSQPMGQGGGARPGGGLMPAQRPSGPGTIGNRPNIGQGGGVQRPNQPIARPGGGAAGLPGKGGSSRPNISAPNIGGMTRPAVGMGDRPQIGGGNRPQVGGGGARPTPGGKGDFLGMDRPLRPETLPATRPGAGGGGIQRPGGGDRPGGGIRPGGGGGGLPPDRPGGGGIRPGGGDNRPGRPGDNLPDIGRPGRPPTNIGNRPIVNRPVNIGNQVNNVINRRPGWANISNNTVNNINNNWNNVIVNRPGGGGLYNWGNRYPNRLNYWNSWGSPIRSNWWYMNRHNNWFGPNWWMNHNHAVGGWNYYNWLPYQPYSYWWRAPTWAGLTSWFTWNAAASPAWSQPIYYDYGQGGNVVYQDNSVYIAGTPMATKEEFAQTAAALATVPPPATQEDLDKSEWMPLGTFAFSTNQKDTEPSRILQLAVNKEGIVSGTLFNSQTDQSASIQGQVDKQTQRLAFRFGEKENVVAETGLYNLTQNEAPVLLHFGAEKTENGLLVRLEDPEGDQGKKGE